jgi:hypothetical protein
MGVKEYTVTIKMRVGLNDSYPTPTPAQTSNLVMDAMRPYPFSSMMMLMEVETEETKA